MTTNLKLFRTYTRQEGVEVSVGVTLFSISMLIIALLGMEFEREGIEAVSLFALIAEFMYGIILCFSILRNQEKYNHLIPFLFLNWFIGCFGTNFLINVFENLPLWVYLLTFVFCISNFFVYSNFKQRIFSPIAYFLNGFSFILIIYYAVYLIPIMPISFIGIMGLGLGFYGLVPITVLILHCFTLIKVLPKDRKNSISFASGIFSLIFCMLIFTFLLNAESQKIAANTVTKSFETHEDIPNYITVSQNLKPNFLNEILLKKELVYVGTDDYFTFRGFDGIRQKQYNERKTHNPFINIAYFFTENLNLTADDRINILKSNFDKRLETEEQLWDGNDLITKNIKEDIKIYSNDRLAYTELTIDIASKKKYWDRKEAIYSFQLPEGSVATSLSLWVNGIERKGVLTTKEKAEKAYKQIVGVEARDPSLMQWKEGNKIVIRIFPITYDMPRTFKCGFTTPLKVIGNQMKYQSLNIKGPNINNAETVSRIQMVGNEKLDTSKDFELKNGFYINESIGLDEWEATMPLSNIAFSSGFEWKNKVYRIKPIEREISAFVPSEIVLDLNTNWNLKEIQSIVSQNNKKYLVYSNNEKQEITIQNCELLFSRFKNLQYSLLPLYKLQENTLVITKSGEISANFEELSDSDYLMKIKSQTKQKNIKVLALSNVINPFWQTIKEQHYVSYYQTDLKKAIQLITKNQFVGLKTNANTVNIEPSNVSIQETELMDKSKKMEGSNHLYRLYAFGKVLEEHVAIQEDASTENKYISLAKDANIVTPISSLIVLETNADYENNGIEKNVNTLGNASINNDGAVPEPHEWMMIILGLTLLFFYYKKTKTQVA
ncbi:MAG: XrtN system VIT domain-containing protein [Bacteroidota bacterium]